MEVQLTDFENAAFTVFVVLLQRVILFFDLNLYIPLSLVRVRVCMRARARAPRASVPVTPVTGIITTSRVGWPRWRTILCARGPATLY